MENYEKKYKEVLEKAKALYKASEPMSGCNVILETLFPELAESEDEKVRKALIDFFGKSANYGGQTNGVYDKDILAWLERQVEQNFEMKTAAESLGVDSETYNKIIDECIFGDQNDSCVKDYNNIDPHFGKSIDKTEPKFHEGEWITNGDYTWKIVEVKPLDYILQSQDGNVVDDTISHVDEQFHSFTIEDAKDGDVLMCNINKAEIGGDIEKLPNITPTICVYRNVVKDKDYIHTYFSLFNGSSLVLSNSMYYNTFVYNIHPATEEQRSLLFHKMKDAGYEWDARNKVMTKIEQKSIDSYCQENCNGFQETGKCFADGECKAKKEAEQKSVWSEEDDYLLNETIKHLEELIRIDKAKHCSVDVQYYQRDIDWLKSLKERIGGKV